MDLKKLEDEIRAKRAIKDDLDKSIKTLKKVESEMIVKNKNAKDKLIELNSVNDTIKDKNNGLKAKYEAKEAKLKVLLTEAEEKREELEAKDRLVVVQLADLKRKLEQANKTQADYKEMKLELCGLKDELTEQLNENKKELYSISLKKAKIAMLAKEAEINAEQAKIVLKNAVEKAQKLESDAIARIKNVEKDSKQRNDQALKTQQKANLALNEAESIKKEAQEAKFELIEARKLAESSKKSFEAQLEALNKKERGLELRELRVQKRENENGIEDAIERARKDLEG